MSLLCYPGRRDRRCPNTPLWTIYLSCLSVTAFTIFSVIEWVAIGIIQITITSYVYYYFSGFDDLGTTYARKELLLSNVVLIVTIKLPQSSGTEEQIDLKYIFRDPNTQKEAIENILRIKKEQLKLKEALESHQREQEDPVV